MKFLRNLCLLFLAFVALLCGCSQSNEEGVKSANRFEELKTLPLDTVLSRALAFYEQFQATNDTLLRDSMNDYKSHFFARWKRSTDSLCATIPADDSLAAEFREIYEAVLKYYSEYYLKHIYWYKLDTARRESLLVMVDSTQKIEQSWPMWGTANEKKDSIREAAIMSIPFDEVLSALKKDSLSRSNVAYRSNVVYFVEIAYFVQSLRVRYIDTVAADMEALQKIDPFDIKWRERKEAISACMEKTPIGQQVLVLNKEYKSLLSNFMKTKTRRDSHFLFREISALWRFWNDPFPFHSFSTALRAIFNKNRDMVNLYVDNGYIQGLFDLSKRSGKWEVVMFRSEWKYRGHKR
jgi:hypothetical protein